MTNSAPTPSDRYTHGHHPSVVSSHARRTAEREAAYLLPHLRAGMHLLDVGCGPGTITTGLARAVAPGETLGIDVSAEVIDQARQHAAGEGIGNVRFETASVYDLPYADASFDVVYANQLLQHLTRPVDALVEMRRVLRPGGIAGLCDADYGTMVGWPRSRAIVRWLEVYYAVAARNGVDPDAGRRLAAWVRAAGFAEIEVSAVVELYAEPGAAAVWALAWAERVLHSNLGAQAREYGIATQQELAEIAAGWREWAQSPEALFMFIRVQCLGRAPA